MLVVQACVKAVDRWDEELEMPFEQREKSRLRTRVRSGEEIGIFIERGTILREGDFLRADDGRMVRVFAAAEALMEARCDDSVMLARVAYHLGNRHAHVQVLRSAIRFPSDAVLGQMLANMGVSVSSVSAPFEPEPGAYGAGNHAHSGEARHAGLIHDFGSVAELAR